MIQRAIVENQRKLNFFDGCSGRIKLDRDWTNFRGVKITDYRNLSKHPKEKPLRSLEAVLSSIGLVKIMLSLNHSKPEALIPAPRYYQSAPRLLPDNSFMYIVHEP